MVTKYNVLNIFVGVCLSVYYAGAMYNIRWVSI